MPTFQTQIKQEHIKQTMNAQTGNHEKQLKMALSADKNQMKVQLAKRVAHELAQHGPITIDDVTRKMSETHDVLSLPGKCQHQWKGSVFSGKDWRSIGYIQSSAITAHSRQIRVWALKSWLTANTMNGKETTLSSFILSRMYCDFKREYKSVTTTKARWYIGDSHIAEDIKSMIQRENNKLYGIEVSWVPNAVGAIIEGNHEN